MTHTMPLKEAGTVHTRASLVQGLQADEAGRWEEFHQVYAPVIRGFALKAGLTETEADEVVQETCIGVARNVGEFHYDPAKCRFKTWLLNQASWRVKNQFARRQRWDQRLHRSSREDADPDRTATIERVPDAQGRDLEALWDQEWQSSLMRIALEKLRESVSATQFQIFDLNVLKEWPAGEVARSLGVSVASVYLAKHRVAAALKKEIARLEREWEAESTRG